MERTSWTTLVTPTTNLRVDSSFSLKEKVCSSDEKVVVKTSLHQSVIFISQRKVNAQIKPKANVLEER